MLEYRFETIAVKRFTGKTQGHQETIQRCAAQGWRYVGWVPTQQNGSGVTEMDLIFEREQGGQA